MATSTIIFLFFIFGLFLLLTLLALNIDLFNRIRFKNLLLRTTIPLEHQVEVDEVANSLNAAVLSDSKMKELEKICPVSAIQWHVYPSNYISISASKCLGYKCSDCINHLEVKQ